MRGECTCRAHAAAALHRHSRRSDRGLRATQSVDGDDGLNGPQRARRRGGGGGNRRRPLPERGARRHREKRGPRSVEQTAKRGSAPLPAPGSAPRPLPAERAMTLLQRLIIAAPSRCAVRWPRALVPLRGVGGRRWHCDEPAVAADAPACVHARDRVRAHLSIVNARVVAVSCCNLNLHRRRAAMCRARHTGSLLGVPARRTALPMHTHPSR